ncbi:MAG: LysR family transcriptional regulator, partial [Bacteroidota bacterium]
LIDAFCLSMELRHLKYFLAVAEELHFRRAAERLYVAQPGLSRQIKQLEVELGVDLFERNNRRVALTPAGQHLQKRVTALLRDLDLAVTETRQTAEGTRGQIRVGYIGSAMQRTLPELILAVNEQYPDIRFSLREMENPAQLRALLNRELDLGFVRMERVPPPLRTRPVYADTFSLVLPAEHPVSADNFASLAQLKEEPFILFERTYSESYYELVMQLFDGAGFTPRVSHTSVNASSIYRLVANGLGLAIVPTILLEGYAMDIKAVELTDVPQRTTLRAVWHGAGGSILLERVLMFV